MQILKANIDHVDLVVPLFDSYRQFYDQKSDPESVMDFLSQRLNRNESVIFVALDEEKNQGIGFVQLYPSFSSVNMKRMWILNDLFVDENYRKQGVAEALIETSRQLAIKSNSSGIVLETQISNKHAQMLYDKAGFVKDNNHHYYFLEV